MDRQQLQRSAAYATHMRGLLLVPLGLLFIATGLGNLGWEPLQSPWVMGPFIAVAGLMFWVSFRYYNGRYGRVSISLKDQAIYGVTVGASLIGGSLLDFHLNLPISLFTILYAAGFFFWFSRYVGLRRYHWVIWGGLLAIGLLPVWHMFSDPVSVAWFPIGTATILAGVFDHLALTRAFDHPDVHELKDPSSAGA